ncbi:MAG: hypothetical protein ACR2KE_04080 [Candidatus Nanopelagicales bacterium]
MRKYLRPGRRALIAVVASALVLGTGVAGPAIASRPQAAEPVPWTWKPVPVPAVEVTDPVIPIFAAVGKDMPVAGAKVEMLADGKVIATGTTGDGGVALIKKAGLPADFAVRISGGTVDGKAWKTVLLSSFDPESGLASADLVTTLIEKFKTQTGTSDWSANYMTLKSLGLLAGVDSVGSRFSTNSRFDGSKFISAADKKGGIDKYMKFLIPQIDKGKRFLFRGNAQQRSTSSDLLSDAAGDLGGYLGLPSPGADIQKKAQDAAKAMQKAFTDMLAMEWKTQILVNQSIYTTETAKVSDFEAGVKFINDKWGTFTQANVKDPGYDSLRKELYNDIRKQVYDNYPQVENYFPATTQGVLKAGHAVFQSLYPYYIPGDVDQIQGMVSYWESLSAAGNLYIVNMYSYDPSLVANIATQNQYAQKIDARVLQAMPDDLSATQVGIWQQGRAYATSSSVYSKGYYYLDYKKITDMADAWGNCDQWSSGYSGTGSPTYITQDQLKNIIYGMVPSGYTLAWSSDSQYLSGVRPGGSPIINYIKAQDQQLQYLTYADTTRVFGQAHTYKDDLNKTHHDWKGETICYATDIRYNGTTVNNQPQLNDGLVLTAWVYVTRKLTAPATF